MKIVIPGPPIPKARARHFQRGSRTITYDPQHEQKNHVKNLLVRAVRKAFDSENKALVMEASSLAHGRVFHLSITFFMALNASDSDGQKNAKLWGLEPCNKKPDCSNMLKFYEDCANEVLYPDDSMIVSGNFKKKFDINPRTEINIMIVDELNVHESVAGILKIFGPDLMENFFNDVSLLSAISSSEVHGSESLDRRVWLESTAIMLSQFAQKYSEALKKIRKFDDVMTILNEKNLGLVQLENGSFRKQKMGEGL